ncbi:MAG TPA: C39 family peptidase [Drouetiella sp.]|jgi:uncharacterized protein YvpB
MSVKINLTVLATLVVLTILAIYVANNPALSNEWLLRARYLNRVVKLPVPYAHQEHSLSCEVACLKMALNYQGAHVSEHDLIKLLPFDATGQKDEGRTWGDPNTGFVGDIDGQMGVTGYGVYWEPIAAVGRHWRKTEILEGGTEKDIAANLAANRPVIVWGYSGESGKPIEWKTPLGKKVSAVRGEHARVVTGFAGDPQNPEVFLISDPYFGELLWSKDELEKNWHSLGDHGVVVYQEQANPPGSK